MCRLRCCRSLYLRNVDVGLIIIQSKQPPSNSGFIWSRIWTGSVLVILHHKTVKNALGFTLATTWTLQISVLEARMTMATQNVVALDQIHMENVSQYNDIPPHDDEMPPEHDCIPPQHDQNANEDPYLNHELAQKIYKEKEIHVAKGDLSVLARSQQDKLKHQLNENPRDMRALQALLKAVLEQRDMLRALTVVETLLEVQPNNLEWKFLKARTHELLGELLMAKQEYEELLILQPLSARFIQGLAKLLNGAGEQTQALELIKEALNKAISEGKNVEARNLGVLLGQFYIQLGNFEDALHHLSSMIDEEPDDFRPHLCQVT
ncbi:hypothetical protein GOP47_0022059 [Adiantum capillus-veneris]|uniref:Uncharacterized protein n=1 Tax=Adiantum capillus-veneris TaxID=13818 RepID=A0A9D4U908_ADICA|nr:hypothetical protein GOP47_0022059 [Adiantum capillus-veneris]